MFTSQNIVKYKRWNCSWLIKIESKKINLMDNDDEYLENDKDK